MTRASGCEENVREAAAEFESRDDFRYGLDGYVSPRVPPVQPTLLGNLPGKPFITPHLCHNAIV